MMELRVRLQLAEALGSNNRWFCSEFYGRKIEDPELLLCYFIRSGGARDFCRRFNEAMGRENRWYCSEFYRRDIRDPEVLWEYYINDAPARAARKNAANAPANSSAELCFT
jgi:hypothetical protein